jgi:hypothetical protein
LLEYISHFIKIINELAAVPPGLEFMKLAIHFLLYCLVLAIITCAIDRVILKQVVARRRILAGMPASTAPSVVARFAKWFKALGDRRKTARACLLESSAASAKPPTT